MAILDDVKLSLRQSNIIFNNEINDIIDAGLADLGLAGVTHRDPGDPLIKMAIVTYCRLRFGSPDDYDRLKKSYDEQKAQLSTATGYTRWRSCDGQK